MNSILRQILAFFFFGLALPVAGMFGAPSGEGAPKTEWRIKVTQDANDNPHSTVDLVINGKQTVRLVTPEEVAGFQVLPSDKYEDYQVPAKALCACRSWWAGAGTKFYVVSNSKGRVEVYRMDVDEGMTSTPRWRRVRMIKVE